MAHNVAMKVAAFATGLAVAPLAYAQGYGYGYGPGMMGGYGWGGGWGFGGIGMLLWWVLIVLGIVLLVKWIFGGGPAAGHRTGDRALEVLKERYARGEIDKNEFEEKKRDLRG
jgi:putative membrane protein